MQGFLIFRKEPKRELIAHCETIQEARIVRREEGIENTVCENAATYKPRIIRVHQD